MKFKRARCDSGEADCEQPLRVLKTPKCTLILKYTKCQKLPSAGPVLSTGYFPPTEKSYIHCTRKMKRDLNT